jgi:hypothetical protein
MFYTNRTNKIVHCYAKLSINSLLDGRIIMTRRIKMYVTKPKVGANKKIRKLNIKQARRFKQQQQNRSFR